MKTFELSSERLRLRPIVEDDLAKMHELLLLPETDRFNALGIPESLDDTRGNVTQWIADMTNDPGLSHTLAIEVQEDSKFIGLFGVKFTPPKYRRAELWYKLHSDHWGRGFATEATKCVIDYCFGELDLHRIHAGAAVDNTGSIRVMEKCGMQREGCLREDLPLKTGFSDSFIYAILKSDWPSSAP